MQKWQDCSLEARMHLFNLCCRTLNSSFHLTYKIFDIHYLLVKLSITKTVTTPTRSNIPLYNPPFPSLPCSGNHWSRVLQKLNLTLQYFLRNCQIISQSGLFTFHSHQQHESSGSFTALSGFGYQNYANSKWTGKCVPSLFTRVCVKDWNYVFLKW